MYCLPFEITLVYHMCHKQNSFNVARTKCQTPSTPSHHDISYHTITENLITQSKVIMPPTYIRKMLLLLHMSDHPWTPRSYCQIPKLDH